MDHRKKSISLILLLSLWMISTMSCSYLARNGNHQVYSKSKHGEDRFIIVQGYNIHYVEVGGGEPVLLIPGAFSTYRHWNRMIPILSKHYRLLCMDYLGVGDSDKPRSGFGYTIEEQADLIALMIGQLQISRVHVVGVSYGGAIALNLAARYPEKVDKIVSIEGNGFNGSHRKEISYGSLEGLLKIPVIGEVPIGVIRSGLADRFVARSVMGKGWKELSDIEKKEVREIISQNNKTASRISWYHISRTLKTSKDFTEEIRKISTPVLYLYGERSGYQEMAKSNAIFLRTHLPNIEVVSLRDGIHDLQLQKPEEAGSIMMEFIGGQPLTFGKSTIE